MRNQEILDLMLEAERRDTPWVESTLRNAEMPDVAKYDCFDECTTVAEVVKVQMEFDEACIGEIDPVNQFHYLRGPNAYDLDDYADWGEY